jgi:phosphate transport system permease protein
MSSELIEKDVTVRSRKTRHGGRAIARASSHTSLTAHGEPLLWLTGGSLALCLIMILLLLAAIAWFGLKTFWPVPVVRAFLVDNTIAMGEDTRAETYRPSEAVVEDVRKSLPPRIRDALEAKADRQRSADPSLLDMLDPETVKRALASRGSDGKLPDAEVTSLAQSIFVKIKSALDATEGVVRRRSLRTGNFELTNSHFRWVDDFMVVHEDQPEWALVIERLAKGRFYGFPTAFLVDEKELATEPAAVWAKFNELHAAARSRYKEIVRLETDDIGVVNRAHNAARLAVKQAELDYGVDSPEHRDAVKRAEDSSHWENQENSRIFAQIKTLTDENARYQMRMQTADGQVTNVAVADIVRAYPANQLGFGDKVGIYFSRWVEFLLDEPRNVNMEGGVFPAIWGTVAMTLIMSALVVPFGVLAALYLREYAKAGPIVSAVRIAVNNLAGVPSIVFGVFGLGFFCYVIGANIDQLFFRAALADKTPTFGTGGLLWASLTLALLTLPVVIVATEEALSAVPNSMREGSYACGASKWQTIRRIVLPRAMPGIMTGMILAMARGAGEVAPLMLVGVVKLAPELPIDKVFPYVHAQRSFMHLGFHIYDVGFQSPNSEAAKPMVFTTTLLLIALIALLNLTAVWLRNRLRRKFTSAQF